MNKNPLMLIILLTSPAWGDVYKCPQPEGPPKFQQMPCTITGEGEKISVYAPKPSSEGGLREGEKAYLQSQGEYRKKQEEDAQMEHKRQEAIAVEKRKAEAAESQARATWYMGSMMGLRPR